MVKFKNSKKKYKITPPYSAATTNIKKITDK